MVSLMGSLEYPENKHSHSLNLSQENLQLLNEARITLMIKPDDYIRRKKTTDQYPSQIKKKNLQQNTRLLNSTQI